METQMNDNYRPNRMKGVGFGLVLMTLGVVLLGLNFGFIPEAMRHILISWQMLLIVIGLGNVIFKRGHHITSGIILIIVGSFFILPRLVEAYPASFPGISTNFTHAYWPLLLIVAGVMIISGKLFGYDKYRNCDYRKHHHRHHRSYYEYSQNNTTNGGFSKNSVFGSGEHIVLDPEFKGGEMNAVFGGISLDLRRTNLPEGDTYLEVNAVFGGITIYVPTGWNVETHLDTVFGGFQDNRIPTETTDTSRRLIIKGSCVFGGGELRN